MCYYNFYKKNFFLGYKMSNINYNNCWEYFERCATNKDKAFCIICKKPISCKNSSTSGLHRHLEGIHSMKRIAKNSIEEPPTKRLKIESANHKDLKTNTLEKIVSVFAAKDGFPIQKICNCEFIRSKLKMIGFTLPKQPTDVMNLIYKYYNDVKKEIIIKINTKKTKNQKFSQSIDEWTSIKNRRYLNIHIYYSSGDSENLGLVRIEGSCPAEKLIELVDEKLKSFGLDFNKDIVSTTSDGARVMVKFGRLSQPHQQLCYNHAIHLAVMSIFYQKSEKKIEILDDENDDCENDYFCEEIDELVEVDVSLSQNMNINTTLNKIRKIVNIFRKSPVRNSVLQNYVKNVEKKELQLLLDCKIRWNSMETMIERFLRIIDSVELSLKDLNYTDLWETEDKKRATEILETLKPVRKAIERLSRQDTNLLTSEGVLKFLFKALEDNASVLSKALLIAIKEEISKRRDKSLISLIKFLHDPSCLKIIEKDNFFKLNSKSDITKTAKLMMNKLYEDKSSTNEINCNNDDKDVTTLNDKEDTQVEPNNLSSQEISLDEKLEACILKTLRPMSTTSDDYKLLTNEINIFNATGKITENLELLRNALNTIRPTSTQNERNFSISGNFVSKIRNRLSDKSIDNLCFLKSFLMKNDI